MLSTKAFESKLLDKAVGYFKGFDKTLTKKKKKKMCFRAINLHQNLLFIHNHPSSVTRPSLLLVTWHWTGTIFG